MYLDRLVKRLLVVVPICIGLDAMCDAFSTCLSPLFVLVLGRSTILCLDRLVERLLVVASICIFLDAMFSMEMVENIIRCGSRIGVLVHCCPTLCLPL